MKFYKILLGIILFFPTIMSLVIAQNSEQYLKGIEALNDKDTLKAIDYFDSSIKRNRDKESYWELAKIYNNYQGVDDLLKARIMVEEAIKKDEKNVEYKLLFGELLEKLFKQSIFDKFARNRAFDVYEKILETNFETPIAHLRLGVLYKEDFYNYVNSYRINVGEIDYQFNNTDPYFDKGSTKIYNEFLNSLMLDDQVTALDYNDLADSFFNKSVSHFLNAIKYDSLNLAPYLDIAMLYDYKGEYEKGIKILLTGIKFFDKSEKLYLELGYLYYNKKEFEKSADSFTKAFFFMSKSELNIYNYKTVLDLFDTKTLDKFYSYTDEQKKVYLKKYWDIKNPLNITKYNERELEHYSRVYYANYYYGLPDQNLKGWETDRGNIIIRYGLPQKYKRIRPDMTISGIDVIKSTFTDPSLRIGAVILKSEIWDYGDKVFSFVDITNRNNFRLSSKSPLSNNYKLPFYGDSYQLSKDLQITKPEGYTPKFEGPLFQIPYNAVQFKNLETLNGETDLYINYALDINDGVENENQIFYKHKVGIFLKDNIFNEIFSDRDSIKLLSMNDEIVSNNKKYVVNSIVISSRPELANLAFEVIREKDKGVSAYHGKITVKDFSSDSLMLSDVVLASKVNFSDESSGTIQRGDYKILPNPTDTFNSENKPFIFYEVYNLKTDKNNLTSFEQEITVREAEEENELSNVINSFLDVIGFDGKGNEITLSSKYSTIETDPQIYLQLDLSDYEPGEYVITILIKDKINGHETSRTAKINWL